MNIVLTVLLPLGLMIALLPAAVRQLRGPTHPNRLLAETLTAGFVLLVCSLLVSMPGWIQLLWWSVLVTVLLAAAVTTWRTAAGTEMDTGTDTDTGTGTSSTGPAEPDRLQPVRRSELLVNGVLWALTLVAAVAGG